MMESLTKKNRSGMKTTQLKLTREINSGKISKHWLVMRTQINATLTAKPSSKSNFSSGPSKSTKSAKLIQRALLAVKPPKSKRTRRKLVLLERRTSTP